MFRRQSRSRESILSFALVVCVLFMVGVIGGSAVWQVIDSQQNAWKRDLSAQRLKEAFDALEKYAANDPGGLYPPASFVDEPFLLEPSLLGRYGIVPEDLMSPTEPQGRYAFPRRKFYYFGFAMWDEEGQALPIMDAMREVGVTNLEPGEPLLTRNGLMFPLGLNVERLVYQQLEQESYREQRQRLRSSLTTQMLRLVFPVAEASSWAIGPSDFPVLMEHPDTYGNGGNVLYLDGHVEFHRYPGDFPMTERFIAVLESFEEVAP